MNRQANYDIVVDDDEQLTLKDIGPWDKYLTITNAAESVVEELLPRLGGRRLFYIDTEDDLTELVIKNGKFSDFKFVAKEVQKNETVTVTFSSRGLHGALAACLALRDQAPTKRDAVEFGLIDAVEALTIAHRQLSCWKPDDDLVH